MTSVESVLIVGSTVTTPISPEPVGRVSIFSLNDNKQFILSNDLLDSLGRFTHKRPITALTTATASSMGKIILSGSADGTVKLWKVGQAGWIALETEAHSRKVVSMRVYQDYLYSIGLDGTMTGKQWPAVLTAEDENKLFQHCDYSMENYRACIGWGKGNRSE